jgi:hypothetical protein
MKATNDVNTAMAPEHAITVRNTGGLPHAEGRTIRIRWVAG